MLPFRTNYTSMYIMFAWILGVCYGFVLLSSADGALNFDEAPMYETGKAWNYHYQITVLLNEKGEIGKDVGFYITSDVLVESVWSGPEKEKLLKIQLNSPKMLIKSRKAPSPEGFVQHTSKLETLSGGPFFILWHKGKVEKILLKKDEPLSLANIKKGLASLFQFRISEGEMEETDVSGHCLVNYNVLSSYKFRKHKIHCHSPEFKATRNPELLLSANLHSTRMAEYEISDEFTYLDELVAVETHELFLAAKEDAGNKVEVQQHLNVYKEKTTTTSYPGVTFEEVLEAINKEQIVTEEALIAERENSEEKPTDELMTIINKYRDFLKTKNMGTLSSAKAVMNIVPAVRRADRKEINKVLGFRKNEKIISQIYDIMGFAQTIDTHEAVMKKLDLDNNSHQHNIERYLWALSMSSQPNPEIIKDLIKRYIKGQNIPEKTEETLLLTIGSMAYRLSKSDNEGEFNKVLDEVKDTLLHGLKTSKEDKRLVYLRALRNFKSQSTISALIEIIKTGTLKEGVLAWKVLASLEPKQITEEVLKTAIKTFFQLDRKHDSSSRTLALQVLLDSKPSDELLQEIFHFMSSKEKSFELKKYIIENIKMRTDLNEAFRTQVFNVIKNDTMFNNYGIMAQKGFSTSLSRSFLNNTSSHGALVSVQEMNNGIVKRGTVDVMLSKGDVAKGMFTLEVFSGGLSSFLSSDSEDSAEEVATAGMELSVLGTQLRPFTFFSGQGELMGHVWSGTASERTTAYQAVLLVQDHAEYLRLGPGFIAELDVKGAVSFDLAGNIEISLWNKNAKSLVEKVAGIAIIGTMKVDTTFVKSQVEFSLSLEPKLQLKGSIDFSGGVNMCMRLTQPEFLFKHNVFKIERIPGSKHKLRKVKYRKEVVPGRTYSLNKKNNEMCNAIFR